MLVVLERVEQTILRHGMFAPAQRVGVAVSGGADSVCLLDVLHELAPRWALELVVLHLDHQLRGEESAADAAFVSELAQRLGLRAYFRQVDVRGISQATGDNLEQAARRVRREFFLGFLKDGRLDRVALGHTRSDQAETVLFRFLRGTGTAGLAGMRPVTPEGFVRPLLEVERAEVLAYLRQRSIPWREDSSNADRGFARNRIRHDLLPALMREWNPALAQALAHTAQLAQDEEQYWSREIERLAATHLEVRPPAVFLRAGKLKELPGSGPAPGSKGHRAGPGRPAPHRFPARRAGAPAGWAGEGAWPRPDPRPGCAAVVRLDPADPLGTRRAGEAR